MNKRIRQLWKDAAVRDDSVHPWTYDPDLHVEKFAELVIKECIDQARSVGDLRGATDDMIYGADIAAVQISKYFGVES